MENWESIQRNRQRDYEAHMQKERERYWHKSLLDAAKHFKHHITQQVEQGLAEYCTALQQIAVEVSQAGAADIMTDKSIMVSRLVRGLTRQLQQKYCPTLSIESRMIEVPHASEAISIDDDSDPPTPASISTILRRQAIAEIKEEPPARQESTTELGQDNENLPEQTRENSQTVTPGRQSTADTRRGRGERPLESTEPDLSPSTRNRANKRARRDDPRLFSETIEDEPTELGSIHCREVEGQDFIFPNENFPGFFFVIRCDGEYSRSGIMFRFPREPLAYNRASNHFKRDTPRPRCHEIDVSGDYSDTQLIRKFGYRVYGDDLGDEQWVKRSNELAERSTATSGAQATPSRGKSKAKTKGKGKGRAVDRGQPVTESHFEPSPTAAGPSTARRSAFPRVPEFGPARRPRASSSTGTAELEPRNPGNNTREQSSRHGTSGDPNVAPVADMGTISGHSPPNLSRGRRNPSRPASRASSRLASILTENMPDGLPTAPPTGVEDTGSDYANDRVIGDLIRVLGE